MTLTTRTLLILSLTPQATGQIVRTDSNPTWERRVIFIPTTQFTIQKIERMFSEFQTDRPGKRFLALEVFRDGPAEIEYRKMLDLNAIDGGEYSIVHHHYPRMKSLRLMLAEVIAVGSDVVMRIHQESGTVVRRVLSGSDPLQFRLSDVRFEVVSISYQTLPAPDRTWLSFYIKYDGTLKPEELARAHDEVAKRFGVDSSFATFRTDTWFIGSEYHFYNPFVSTGEMPPWDEYSTSKAGSCKQEDGHVRCVVGTVRNPGEVLP